jgi:hypothetical protein
VQASQEELRAFDCTTHSPQAPEPLEPLLDELEELDDELELPLHVETAQYSATSSTHSVSHFVLQQYESFLQTAAVHASHEELRDFECVTHSPQVPLVPCASEPLTGVSFRPVDVEHAASAPSAMRSPVGRVFCLIGHGPFLVAQRSFAPFGADYVETTEYPLWGAYYPMPRRLRVSPA